jgi:hypothetical protein
MTTFTKEQNMELAELLENMEYDTFVEKVEEFTGDVNLGYDLLDKYYEMLDRT